MKAGDTVWVVYRDGSADTGRVDYVGQTLISVRFDDGEIEHYLPQTLSAMQTLHAASEAVAKARDAVVAAAKRQHMAWRSDLALPNADYDDRVAATEEAARLLVEAERVEAEARAKLEALR